MTPNPKPPEAKSQRIDFSCIQRMVSYIPMIRGDALAYPLIACNVDGIDKVSARNCSRVRRRGFNRTILKLLSLLGLDWLA